MAWIDDRIWCHPKFTGLSAEAFRVYVHGLAYSAGLSTGGRLTREQQNLIGTDTKTRRELLRNLLWEPAETEGEISIHHWDEHNGKRDARRAADRERKRLARAKERAASAGQAADKTADSPQDVPQDSPQPVLARGAAHVEGSEGSDGSEEEPSILPAVVHNDANGRTAGRPNEIESQLLEPDAILAAIPHADDIQWSIP